MIDALLKKPFPLFLAVLLFGLLSAPLYAQTAAELEELLGIQAVSYGQAARFALEAADAANLKSAEQAFTFAAGKRWLPQKAAAGDAARLDGVSLLLMQAFGVKGGMWYSLTKNPHYAYRELVYLDVIQGRSDPQMTVSGEQLLFLINRLLSRQESAATVAAGKGQS